jgi:signal transduction histidine kinase/CheY-like chemotaxis protein
MIGKFPGDNALPSPSPCNTFIHMLGLGKFRLFAPPSLQVLGAVHRLVAQVTLVAGCASGFLGAAIALNGGALRSYVPMLLQTLGFAFTYARARQQKPDSFHMILLLVWLTIVGFDDGFQGTGITWVFYIPLSLGILLFLPRGRGQVAWLFSVPVGLLLVSFTPWTPRLNVLIPQQYAIVSIVSNFIAAIVASLLTIRFLLDQNNEALAKAQAASRAKSEFLSHMSHEFRTPLNAISGFTELIMLDSGKLDAAVSEHLQAIRTSSEHLLGLVNDVLDLSRMENARLQLNPLPFSPGRALEELCTTLRPLAGARGLELKLEIEGDIPVVDGDRLRWLQILLNLVGNAIRYTSDGHVRIHARWDDQRNILVVKVQDTGPGIPQDKLASIFEPYTRLEESNPKQAHGTGLGLAIARKLVGSMEGQLEVESVLGHGTAFLLRVPFAKSHELQKMPEAPATLASDLTGIRILLCEDTPMNVRLATQVLDRLGALYAVAEDGGQSLERLREGGWDLVLLDLHMPIHDGFEVARRVRDPHSDIPCKQVPILALTADASPETIDRIREAGMDDIMTKPFRLSMLSERIHGLIQLKRDQRGESV